MRVVAGDGLDDKVILTYHGHDNYHGRGKRMPGHHPNPPVDNEAPFGRTVVDLFREHGWKVLKEPREQNVAPDFLLSGHGKKLVVELKRASEGRKDRVIPLLSQAALEAVHYSRVIPGHPVPSRLWAQTVFQIPLPRKRSNF